MATAAAAGCSGDGRVVQVLVDLPAVLVIFVSLWLLMASEQSYCYLQVLVARCNHASVCVFLMVQCCEVFMYMCVSVSAFSKHALLISDAA